MKGTRLTWLAAYVGAFLIAMETKSISHRNVGSTSSILSIIQRWRHLKNSSSARFAREDGSRNSLNPQKYRYSLDFDDLEADNTHIVAIVLFRFREDEVRTPIPNNYIVTAYQKEIG